MEGNKLVEQHFGKGSPSLGRALKRWGGVCGSHLGEIIYVLGPILWVLDSRAERLSIARFGSLQGQKLRLEEPFPDGVLYFDYSNFEGSSQALHRFPQ